MNRPINRPPFLLQVLISLFGMIACSAFAQTDAVQRLRNEAKEARTDAAKKSALAQEYRDQAQNVRRRAADAKKQAADARKIGKFDRAVMLEQQARSDENEVARRLDKADAFDQDSERLLKVAKDKEDAANRLAQDVAPPDMPTAVYQRTSAFLRKTGEQGGASRARTASQFIGKQYDSPTARDAVFTQVTLNDIYSDTDPIRAYFADVDKAWAQYKVKNGTASDLADACYSAVYYSLPGLVHREFRTASVEIAFLATDFRRLSESLEGEYSRTSDALQVQYQAGSITGAEKAAKLQELAQRQSGQMKTLFDSSAPRYRSIMLRLARFRRDWAAELKNWHDWAAKTSKGANDVHDGWARAFEKAAFSLFSKEAGPTAPLNVVRFAYTPGSPDRINTRCGAYKWCRLGLFPDIQDPDTPYMLRMWNLVDVKLEESVTSGKVDGAAAAEAP